MKNVMSRAWTIARQGKNKFGGETKEYFAVALKMAWKEVKTQANLFQKAKDLYEGYIQNILNKGGKLVSKNGTDYVIENMGKNHTVTLLIEDSTVKARVDLEAEERTQFAVVGTVA